MVDYNIECENCKKQVKKSEAKCKHANFAEYDSWYCLPCYDKLFGEEERENERKEQEKDQKEYE